MALLSVVRQEDGGVTVDVHEPQFTDHDAQTFCGALELYLRQNPGKALKITTGMDGSVALKITEAKKNEGDPKE